MATKFFTILIIVCQIYNFLAMSTGNDGSSKYTFNVSDIAYGDLKLSLNGNTIIVKKRHNCHYSVISEYPVAKDAINPEAKIEKGILTITAWESEETEKLPESRIHKIPIIMNANGTAMANEYPYFSITKNVSEILVEDLEVSFIEDPFSSNKIRIKKRREPCSYTVIKRLPKANNSYPEKGKLMKNGILIVTASPSKNGKRNFDSIPIEKE